MRRDRKRLAGVCLGIAAVVVVVIAVVVFPRVKKDQTDPASSTAPAGSSLLSSSDFAFFVQLSDAAQTYCKNPSPQPPAKLASGTHRLIAFYRQRPDDTSPGPQFKGETVRQITGDFAGLFKESDCAPQLGNQLERALAKK